MTKSFTESLKRFDVNIDQDTRDRYQFCPKEPESSTKLSVTESQLGVSLPPSYTDFLSQNGCGSICKNHTRVVWRLLPLEDTPLQDDEGHENMFVRTALDQIASELEVAATAESVAGVLGLAVSDVSVLGLLVVFALEGQDLVAFDFRSQNPETLECTATLIFWDDCEIKYLAQNVPKICQRRGFDDYFEEVVREKTMEIEA